MSKWTANLRPGVLKRSEAYDSFVRKDWKDKQIAIKKQNWKAEQIALLKKQRAIAARLKSRADKIDAEASLATNPAEDIRVKP